MFDIKLRGPQGKIIIPYYAIDAVGVEERALSFTKRSLKGETKLQALNLALSMVDLTTLEGMDTAGKVKQICGKALVPLDRQAASILDSHLNLSQVAAVCVYPNMVSFAAQYLKNQKIQIASVATGFPAGQIPLKFKLAEVRQAVKDGASEIDMVIDRGAFHCGKYQQVFDEIVAVKKACGSAHLKVILETGELKTYDKVRLASWIAMEAGADFIKTSTGKVDPAATMPVTLVMLQAIADFYDQNKVRIGMKPAGGIRTAKQALHYLCMLDETLGKDWMTPKLFRFGASSLMNDLLRQILKQITGYYYDEYSFSRD